MAAPVPTQIPGPGASAQPHQSTASTALESKGFLRSLFDFSFSSFVTLRVIRVLYVLITIIYSLVAIVAFIVLLAAHKPGTIAAAIIGVPLAYLVYLIFARIMMELLMVVFNIGKDVRTLREHFDVTTLR
jgi:hypothetical protein